MEENKSANIVSGAKAVLMALREEGVDTIFGYPGGAIMPIYDEMYGDKDVFSHYLVRHEQGGAHAAQAYAMTSGKVGVCFATSGPGATNLITGIVNAHVDSVPVIFITAQVVSTLLGTDAFQETDVVGLTMPVTKWNFQITKAEEIPEAISKAFYIAASGRPGPVVIDITKDAQVGKVNYTYEKTSKMRGYTPYPQLDTDAIDCAAELINTSKKPMILAGHGVLIAKAEKQLMAFAEKFDCPVASTLLGLSAFPTEHPLYTGMLGMHGNYAPNVLTNEADLLIAIGMRFDDRVTGNLQKYAKQAKIIHIEIDDAEINKNVKVDVSVNADLKAALTRLTPRIEPTSHQQWLREYKVKQKDEFERIIKRDCHSENGKIRMGEVVHSIAEKTKGQAIVVTDVGQQQMVAARYSKFAEPNLFISSGGLGTMGFGLPAAMGAKVGQPNREVIAYVGDGGFQMTIQELGTLMQYGIKPKIVILNNEFLGMVRQWQEMFFDKRYASTDMKNPDFVKIADAYGIKGKKVAQRGDLQNAIDEMLAHDGAYLLEVIVEKEGNVFPMVPPGASVSDILLD